MIDFATDDMLETIAHFVHAMNNQPTYYSGYMSLSKSRIHQDIKAAIAAQGVLVAKDSDLEGVLITHTNPDQKTCDMAGPYVVNEDLNVGKTLIDHWIQNHAQGLTLQFFFHRQSAFYHRLMKAINAGYQGDETILTLSKADYQPDTTHADVSAMTAKQRDAVKRLHDTTFPSVYITGEDVVAPHETHDVYVLTERDAVIGYGLVKHHGTMGSLEVFAIDRAHRGQGRAKPFISCIIDDVFKKKDVQTVQLVVENVNRTALNLYTAMGFVVSRENCAYCFTSVEKRGG